jgi:hypothetical protein
LLWQSVGTCACNKSSSSERTLIKFDMGKASSLMYRQNLILARVGQLRPPHEAILDLGVEEGKGRDFVFMKLVFIFRKIIVVSEFVFLACCRLHSPLNYFCPSDNF